MKSEKTTAQNIEWLKSQNWRLATDEDLGFATVEEVIAKMNQSGSNTYKLLILDENPDRISIVTTAVYEAIISAKN